MTDRERWTVYPLLFLALGISLKNAIVTQEGGAKVVHDELVCKKLLVANDDGTVGVLMQGGTLQATSVAVGRARPQNPVPGQLYAKSIVGNTVAVFDEHGTETVAITSNDQGGIVQSTGAIQSTSMVCNTLVIPDSQGKQAVALSSNDHGGFVRTMGSETGTITFLGNTDTFAGLLFIDSHGAIHPGPVFASPVPATKPPQQPSSDDTKPDEAAPTDEAPNTEKSTTEASKDDSPQEQPADDSADSPE